MSKCVLLLRIVWGTDVVQYLILQPYHCSLWCFMMFWGSSWKHSQTRQFSFCLSTCQSIPLREVNSSNCCSSTGTSLMVSLSQRWRMALIWVADGSFQSIKGVTSKLGHSSLETHGDLGFNLKKPPNASGNWMQPRIVESQPSSETKWPATKCNKRPRWKFQQHCSNVQISSQIRQRKPKRPWFEIGCTLVLQAAAVPGFGQDCKDGKA